MHVTLVEAKTYLRVDTGDEDDLIQGILAAAEKQVQDITRLSDSNFAADNATIKIAVLYTLAYFYEHREEADHHELNLTLRSLLFGTREAEF